MASQLPSKCQKNVTATCSEQEDAKDFRAIGDKVIWFCGSSSSWAS